MAGIYIHIPFCKKKCIYCDFYSIGTLNEIPKYPLLIEKELVLRKNFIGNLPIDTIYFGGGTPSLLEPKSIAQILNSISKSFVISESPEITIEVNPDDLTKEILKGYYENGVNRLSLGVQSFNDKELIFLGRRHIASAAEKSIELSLNNGLDNLSIDLIYGLPESTLLGWENNLKKAFSFGIKHLSCYHLTYEKGTILTRRLQEQKIREVDESISVQQFNLLRELSSQNGFIHYEVSNLAKNGFFSHHNTSYWQGVHYLGLGPAAHSYNGLQREWNQNSYTKWVLGIESEKPASQSEIIDNQKRFNETILTRLRTIWGVDISNLENEFGKSLVKQLIINAEPYFKENKIIIKNNHLLIPPAHYFTSDAIISDLIIIDD